MWHHFHSCLCSSPVPCHPPLSPTCVLTSVTLLPFPWTFRPLPCLPPLLLMSWLVLHYFLVLFMFWRVPCHPPLSPTGVLTSVALLPFPWTFRPVKCHPPLLLMSWLVLHYFQVLFMFRPVPCHPPLLLMSWPVSHHLHSCGYSDRCYTSSTPVDVLTSAVLCYSPHVMLSWPMLYHLHSCRGL